jgi:hypothetical protein
MSRVAGARRSAGETLPMGMQYLPGLDRSP